MECVKPAVSPDLSVIDEDDVNTLPLDAVLMCVYSSSSFTNALPGERYLFCRFTTAALRLEFLITGLLVSQLLHGLRLCFLAFDQCSALTITLQVIRRVCKEGFTKYFSQAVEQSAALGQ